MIKQRPVSKTPVKRVLLTDYPEPATDPLPLNIGTIKEAEFTEAMRHQVIGMIGAGCSIDTVANIMKVSDDTLRKHCAFELANGAQLALGKVGGRMFDIATMSAGGAAVEAGKFWLASKSGWRSVQGMEMSGPNGEPIAINAAVGILTDESRAIKVLQLLNKVRAGGAGSTAA